MLFWLLYQVVHRLLGTCERANDERDVEILVLRHQLSVLRRQVKRPKLTSGPHPWELASEVERRALRLNPASPLNGADRGGDSSPPFGGSRPTLDPAPGLGDTWSAPGSG